MKRAWFAGISVLSVISCFGISGATAEPDRDPVGSKLAAERTALWEKISGFHAVAKTSDKELNDLLVKRYEAAARCADDAQRLFAHGEYNVDEYVAAIRRINDARLGLSDDRGDRIATLQTHLDLLKNLEADTIHLQKIGACSITSLDSTKYARLDFEVSLLKETRAAVKK